MPGNRTYLRILFPLCTGINRTPIYVFRFPGFPSTAHLGLHRFSIPKGNVSSETHLHNRRTGLRPADCPTRISNTRWPSRKTVVLDWIQEVFNGSFNLITRVCRRDTNAHDNIISDGICSPVTASAVVISRLGFPDMSRPNRLKCYRVVVVNARTIRRWSFTPRCLGE